MRCNDLFQKDTCFERIMKQVFCSPLPISSLRGWCIQLEDFLCYEEFAERLLTFPWEGKERKKRKNRHISHNFIIMQPQIESKKLYHSLSATAVLLIMIDKRYPSSGEVSYSKKKSKFSRWPFVLRRTWKFPSSTSLIATPIDSIRHQPLEIKCPRKWGVEVG